MSDHGETIEDPGYHPPVPELDDHRRHHSSSTHRPRRGTHDSLYAREAQLQSGREPDTPTIVVRDFEEAIIDDGGADPVQRHQRARRPTIESVHEEREPSPPNSVKAFAAARRRERDLSFSESPDDDGLSRAMSVSSRRSYRSRPRTVDKDNGSILTTNTAEEDVCFPHDDKHRKDKLYIDFDFLECFMHAEQAARVQSRERQETASFDNLQLQHADTRRTQVATSDGDILEMPSDDSVTREKEGVDDVERLKSQHAGPTDSNRYSFFSTAWESTIHAADLADLVLPGEDIRGLFELPEDETDGVWWLNCNNPSREEVQGICRAFGIHPLTIEDIKFQEAREKIELFPSYYFACFRSFNAVVESDGDREFEPFNLYVIVFREGTLSFSFAPNSHATQVRNRITALKDYMSLSSDWICYALIDNIVDSFGPVIHQLEREADDIEDAVFIMREDDSSQFLRSIGQARKNCMALMRLLGGKADVLRGFTKRCNENWQVTPRMDIGMYLGDIQDHVVTMATNLSHFEKILSRAHSNYLATLSINNISQGTEMNRVLSKITFLASVLVPLNLVSGVFGMNVPVPFMNVDSNNLAPFFGIISCMIFLCALILGWARYYRWI
ncbi:putative metal ion transporter-like protein [Emericellopsis cladophorae]|uniref:Metal ion transporter-like protein n=1 Tax=Emericellopsis cladophorae TaxID=2686198 RepID=A0A9P9XWY5_9HYPO|nr:putative metal ion transporter-like protein [Emericellopsis cladophorae]KAI6779191.1 putative metal ion transporter-like protein [Emericellopsis cladophorae]